jgi:HEAT repeat protein
MRRLWVGILIAGLSGMSAQTINSRTVVFLVLVFFFLSPALLGQELNRSQSADVPTLIKRLEDKNTRVAMDAANSLVRVGESVVPLLVDNLKHRKSCQFQFAASGVIYQIEHKPETVNPILADISWGKCKGSSQSDLLIRRQAAIVLGSRAVGIPIMVEMLKDKDTFNRRSAVFAFDELTERIEEKRPDGIKVTPEILNATKAAIPSLVQALEDKDEVVRCMSYESLQQLQKSMRVELRAESSRLLQGITVRCSK